MSRRPKKPGTEPKRDYEVGYGKPPVQHRWGPGQSGNPNKRRKQRRSIGESADKALRSRVRLIDPEGRRRSMPAEDAMMLRFRDAGLKGDVKAATFVFTWAHHYRAAKVDQTQEPELSPEDLEIIEALLERTEKRSKRKAAAKPDPDPDDSESGDA